MGFMDVEGGVVARPGLPYRLAWNNLYRIYFYYSIFTPLYKKVCRRNFIGAF